MPRPQTLNNGYSSGLAFAFVLDSLTQNSCVSHHRALGLQKLTDSIICDFFVRFLARTKNDN